MALKQTRRRANRLRLHDKPSECAAPGRPVGPAECCTAPACARCTESPSCRRLLLACARLLLLLPWAVGALLLSTATANTASMSSSAVVVCYIFGLMSLPVFCVGRLPCVVLIFCCGGALRLPLATRRFVVRSRRRRFTRRRRRRWAVNVTRIARTHPHTHTRDAEKYRDKRRTCSQKLTGQMCDTIID